MGDDIVRKAPGASKVILPRQNLIQAVLRPQDTVTRLRYSLSATLLGRMCLSGDITTLPTYGQRIVDDAIAFYRRAIPVIKAGFSRRSGPPVLNCAHPDGWQAVIRTNDEHAQIVIHTFGGELPQRIELPIPVDYELAASFAGANTHRLRDGIFEYCPSENLEGAAYLLRRNFQSSTMR